MKHILKIWAVSAVLGLGIVSCQQSRDTQALESRIKALETQVQTLQKDITALKNQIAKLSASKAGTSTAKKSSKETQGVKPRPPKKKGG